MNTHKRLSSLLSIAFFGSLVLVIKELGGRALWIITNVSPEETTGSQFLFVSFGFVGAILLSIFFLRAILEPDFYRKTRKVAATLLETFQETGIERTIIKYDDAGWKALYSLEYRFLIEEGSTYFSMPFSFTSKEKSKLQSLLFPDNKLDIWYIESKYVESKKSVYRVISFKTDSYGDHQEEEIEALKQTQIYLSLSTVDFEIQNYLHTILHEKALNKKD